MAPGEKERGDGPAKSALRKVHTATLVITLARGWQQWANENSIRQAQEPAGWMPGGTQDPPDASGPAIDAPTRWKAQRAPKPSSPKPEGCGEDGLTLGERDNCEGQQSFRRQASWVERETLNRNAMELQ